MCGKGDSNSHARYRRYHLKVVRLPISPSPHLCITEVFPFRERKYTHTEVKKEKNKRLQINYQAATRPLARRCGSYLLW